MLADVVETILESLNTPSSGFVKDRVIPAMWMAIHAAGNRMVVSIFVAEFLLLLNTGPLNAAVINSVGAHIRATALAVNVFVLHLLGDVPSASLIGYMSDRYSLQSAFIAPVVAIALSSAILFYGMNFAPGGASTSPAQLPVANRSS